ncbi:MAG: carbon-nitrogen hydrolase family protein, partial [Sulfurimonas sp.]
QGVKVLLLGEYILNPFFKELQTLSNDMIKEHSEHQIKVLRELASTYNLTIIAPIIIVKKANIYKVIAKFAPSSTSYYQQQLLISYPHWNEEKFFANEQKAIEAPLIFKIEGFKFAIISGFELHFDKIFEELSHKNVDCILVPSVSTFDSYERWKALVLSRAFTQNCYILRANRIGEYKDKEFTWRFYGDSLLASPNGELLEHLGNKEELMIVQMHHSEVLAARRFWGFRDMIHKRSSL